MSLELKDLEFGGIRKLMLEEIERDIKEGSIYLSPRLKQEHHDTYIKHLKDSVISGNDGSLAIFISKDGCLKKYEQRKTKNGLHEVSVPINAHITLAEGEFNRFYIRGVCRKAIELGKNVKIYRAKNVDNPRMESESLIGKILDPKSVLSYLRGNIGVDTTLGIPAGPNSGLSVCIIEM